MGFKADEKLLGGGAVGAGRGREAKCVGGFFVADAPLARAAVDNHRPVGGGGDGVERVTAFGEAIATEADVLGEFNDCGGVGSRAPDFIVFDYAPENGAVFFCRAGSRALSP